MSEPSAEARKEPLEDAPHVRSAIARLCQMRAVTDAEKDAAWERIEAAAKRFGLEMAEGSRDERKPAHGRKWSEAEEWLDFRSGRE